MVAFNQHAYLSSGSRRPCRLILGRNRMQKNNTLAHAAKVVVLCLPPVVMLLIGLAALSRKKDGAVVVAGKQANSVRRLMRKA